MSQGEVEVDLRVEGPSRCRETQRGGPRDFWSFGADLEGPGGKVDWIWWEAGGKRSKKQQDFPKQQFWRI